MISIHRFHICRFVYLLKLIGNHETITPGTFPVGLGHKRVQRGKTFESPHAPVPG